MNLLRLDRADREELRQIQIDRLRSLIEHAGRNVSYYADTFGKAGVSASSIRTLEDLTAIPTIDKRQIAANFPDRITARNSNRDTWQYFATSGTTDRLMVIKDAEAMARNAALSLYEEYIQGTYSPGSLQVNIPPDACSLACANATRPRGAWVRAKNSINDISSKGALNLPRWFSGALLRRVATPGREMPSFGPEGTRISPDLLDWYVEEIRRRQPAVLSGLPTYLQVLARHIEERGKPPPAIGSLLPQGSLTTRGLKEKLARIFGVPIHEVYGGHEFGCVGSTCERLDRLHVMMSECLVEVVRNGKHVPPGEIGEIVITAFNNRVMPLIRYRPGDVGRLYDDYCTCGRQTQLLVVEGRIQNTMVTSRGIIAEQEIIDFLAKWPNIEFAQLVQRSATKCDLLIVQRDSATPDVSALADATAALLGEEMEVRPRITSTIKPEVSGKFRFVKSTSFQNFHEFIPTTTVQTNSAH